VFAAFLPPTTTFLLLVTPSVKQFIFGMSHSDGYMGRVDRNQLKIGIAIAMF
jgi:hypothetical protein